MAAVCLNLLTSFAARNLDVFCPSSNGCWVAAVDLGVSGVLAAAEQGARVRLRSGPAQHVANVFAWDVCSIQKLQAPLLGVVIVSHGRDIRIRTGTWGDETCLSAPTSYDH